VRDGVIVGQTPLSIVLDATELGAHPASFELRMRGRETLHFTQGPSDGDVAIVRHFARPQRGGGHHAPSTGRGGDLSIKTQR
jgi:hypothetical protein